MLDTDQAFRLVELDTRLAQAQGLLDKISAIGEQVSEQKIRLKREIRALKLEIGELIKNEVLFAKRAG